jgi:hypothetical protein
MTSFSLPRPASLLLREVLRLAETTPAGDADEALLRLFRVLWPEQTILIIGQASRLWAAAHYRAARELLEQADAAHPRDPLIKAWLALTLLSLRDGLWQSYVEEVRILPHHALARQVVEIVEKASRGQVATGRAEAETPPADPDQAWAAHPGVPC